MGKLTELKRAGLRLTPQRLAIVRELEGDESHPTAQELFERLRPSFPTMSFATVYNTLDTLAKLRLVGALKHGAAVRYDPNLEPHHHAICDRCGEVVDLPAAPPSPAVQESIANDIGFVVRTEERSYRGLCGRCSRQGESNG
jgi:Fe2+ or Zn2+ uptake regulation protein